MQINDNAFNKCYERHNSIDTTTLIKSYEQSLSVIEIDISECDSEKELSANSGGD